MCGGVVLRRAAFRGSSSVLHMPADCAGPLNVARYLVVIRLTAPCSPVGAPAVWDTPEQAAERARLDVGPGGGVSDAGLRRSEPATRPRSSPTHEIERQGRWKLGGGMVGRYTRGECAGSALRNL